MAQPQVSDYLRGMSDPTTELDRRWKPYGRTAARIIAAALDHTGSDTVARSDLRRAWYLVYPGQNRRTPGDPGRTGRPRLNGGLRWLAQQGVITRDLDTVRVLDRAKLAEIIASATRDDPTPVPSPEDLTRTRRTPHPRR